MHDDFPSVPGFEAVSPELQWTGQSVIKPETDASGSADLGSVDSLTSVDSSYTILGDWGEINLWVVAGTITVPEPFRSPYIGLSPGAFGYRLPELSGRPMKGSGPKRPTPRRRPGRDGPGRPR
jgi:hypothetical protein